MKKIECERSAFIGDLHIPFHWKPTIDVVLEFLKWFQPNFVFIVGDLMDMYAVSHFDKNPQRLLSLQDELDQGVLFLKQLRKAVGRECKIVYLTGNHENRLIKYLWRHPELSPLKVLTMGSLLELDKKSIGVELIDSNKIYKHHDFIVTHGHIVRKHSAYTAKGQMDAYGMSGISGHTHRLGTHYLKDESVGQAGVKVWYENGCLCNLDPEYCVSPNWQHGISVGYFINHGQRHTGRFHIIPIPIVKSKIFFDGLLFGKEKIKE